jgi:hypothetical protein
MLNDWLYKDSTPHTRDSTLESPRHAGESYTRDSTHLGLLLRAAVGPCAAWTHLAPRCRQYPTSPFGLQSRCEADYTSQPSSFPNFNPTPLNPRDWLSSSRAKASSTLQPTRRLKEDSPPTHSARLPDPGKAEVPLAPLAL